MLISLSFLNARPYTTLASMIPEALRLPQRPEDLGGLVRTLAQGAARDPTGLRARVERVYAQLEDLHRDHGTSLGAGEWEALAPSPSQG